MRSKNLGIQKFLMAGYDWADWTAQQNLKTQFPNDLLCSIGLHPWLIIQSTNENLMSQFEKIQATAIHSDFIGETGIDFHIENGKNETAKQINYFEAHLELAKSLNKPLILHIVKAHKDAIRILQKYFPENLKSKNEHTKPYGLIHYFSGSFEVAQQYIDLGFKISIGPGILEKGFQKLKDAAIHIKDNDYVFETDSPPPTDNPKLLMDIVTQFAEIRKEPVQKVIDHSVKTFKSLL